MKNNNKLFRRIVVAGIVTTYISANVSPLLANDIKMYNKSGRVMMDNPILVPNNLYIIKDSILEGNTQYLFNNNADLMSRDTRIMKVESTYGTAFNNGWKLSTKDIQEGIPNNFEVKYSTPYNGESEIINVELVDKSNKEEVRLLAIGDSLTRAGEYLNEIDRQLNNIKFYGTREYSNDGLPAREGRGGWKVDMYMNDIGTEKLDSPFVFPIGVDGDKYRGNTYEWRKICYETPNEHTYAGFQKLARGWKTKGEYLYDRKGYFKYPRVGDVMVDPTLAKGKQWVEWNGTKWVSIKEQPTQFEFSFSKYMEKFKAVYKDGTPTHVSILLGANDFGYSNTIQGLDKYIEQIDMMIESIHEFDPSIKVIICTPTPAPDTSITTGKMNSFYEDYDIRMGKTVQAILNKFDNDTSIKNNIFIAPMHLTLNVETGYTYIPGVEDGNKVIKVDNQIHPNNSHGQKQMGNTLAAVIQKTR